MKRIIIYSILATMLSACTDEPSAPVDMTDQYEMHFKAVTGVESRVINGIYDAEEYPANRLYLTAYLQDSLNVRQYYFTDMLLNYDSSEGEWTAPDWYWPLQGNMSFLSYWCSGFSKAPTFDEIFDIDGHGMSRMRVDATSLDGRTDFLYLSQTGVKCPQIGTTTLKFTHGLSWITMTVKAEVLNSDATAVDSVKTQNLIDHLTINKIILEDCSRKGFATIVPGQGIIWKTYCDTVTPNISYVRDQVYYKHIIPTDYFSPFRWEEYEDGSAFTPDQPLPKLTMEPQFLGLYNPPDGTYVYSGLLIVPQNKTAITIDYEITSINSKTIHKIERYELRDNSETWLPGYHYNYDIVFRNYSDYQRNFNVLPTWEAMTANSSNPCFDGGIIGQLDSYYNSGNKPGIVIDHLHDGGSGFGDDMDYMEGGKVF